MEAFRKIYPGEFYRKFLVHKVRPDGRGLRVARKTLVSPDPVSSAAGSCFVRLGSTSLLCGVRAELGPDPTQGRVACPPPPSLLVTLELPPLAAPGIPRGRPTEAAQTLSHTLNTLLSSAVDPESLGVPLPGLRWYLYADVYVLEHAGNLLDAALLAVAGALGRVRLPNLSQEGDGGEVFSTPERSHPLRLKDEMAPLSLSMVHLDGMLLVDPTSEEELLAEGALSMVLGADGVVRVLLQTGLPLPEALLPEALTLAEDRCRTLRARLPH